MIFEIYRAKNGQFYFRLKVFYDSITAAAKAHNIKKCTLQAMFKNRFRNKTPLILT